MASETYEIQNAIAATLAKTQAIHGLEIITDGSPTADRHAGIIQVTEGATFVGFNTRDGKDFDTPQALYVGCYLPGHWANLTFTGTWIAIKADPRIADTVEPE